MLSLRVLPSFPFQYFFFDCTLVYPWVFTRFFRLLEIMSSVEFSPGDYCFESHMHSHKMTYNCAPKYVRPPNTVGPHPVLIYECAKLVTTYPVDVIRLMGFH